MCFLNCRGVHNGQTEEERLLEKGRCRYNMSFETYSKSKETAIMHQAETQQTLKKQKLEKMAGVSAVQIQFKDSTLCF
jgi:hypothetical protein